MAMVPLIDAILDAVETELLAVAGIGKVVNGERDRTDPKDFEDEFVDVGGSDTVRAWIISIGGMNTVEDDAGCLFITTHIVRIDGFVTFDQTTDSHPVFRALLNDVLSKLHGNSAIFGDAPLREDTGSTVTTDFQMLGKVLCHHAQIEILVESEETK